MNSEELFVVYLAICGIVAYMMFGPDDSGGSGGTPLRQTPLGWFKKAPELAR